MGKRRETGWRYLDRYPSLRGDPDSVLALIFNEISLREAFGELPSVDEYTRRFPDLAQEVAEQFEVHRALRVCPGTVESAPDAGQWRRPVSRARMRPKALARRAWL